VGDTDFGFFFTKGSRFNCLKSNSVLKGFNAKREWEDNADNPFDEGSFRTRQRAIERKKNLVHFLILVDLSLFMNFLLFMQIDPSTKWLLI